MARTKSFCPYCGSVVPSGRRCSCIPKPKRKPTQGDKTRAQREPWRKEYATAEYQDARQRAIARTNGRCSVCGRTCATLDHGKWRTAGMGGEVHHIEALCEGGTNGSDNLALVCKSCHATLDARRRKARL